MPVVSYVQCELIRAISHDRLVRQISEVDPRDTLQIAKIVSRMLGF
ncbi:hypothetical protein [Mycolicibacterium brumae]|nr:hypothetical protein [Mycolicibacterium brumae]MCV7194323.1 hypothetical protein [Mycolicibacterium brumae]RWA15529.1 hypothetical protein MBRU_10790 [Mycolicibacterium brumae DSM 44177]UWW10640.1 hypothetical protein L2Z93_003774 [Mycolicibacterium brumae]